MRALLSCVVIGFFLFAPASARGDDVTPGLGQADLVAIAQSELGRELAARPPSERARLAGTYVAVDPDVSDPFAQIACDDDGDHVVVISEAMLRLLAYVATAVALDEVMGTQKARTYALFLPRAQVAGRRLVPPPSGVFDGAAGTTPRADRLVEMIAFVVDRELARLRAGDLVCPSPTATRENGDGVWSVDEQTHAREVRARIYGHARPDEAAVRSAFASIDSTRSDQGALGLLRFFAALEASAPTARWPSYVVLHPGASARLEALRADAANNDERRH